MLAPPDSNKKILLVDDSPTALMWEKLILRDEPFAVTTATDGQEAVARAREFKPDLILLDVVMPNMDGIEACRRLRAESATASVPIIMVTTRSEMSVIEDAYRSGCSDCVTKPIDRQELLTKVRGFLGLGFAEVR